MLTFKVIGVCYQDASSYKDKDVDFYLEEDNWNDYGYRTIYHVHAGEKLTGSKTTYIGSIHIMHQEQGCDEYGLSQYYSRGNNIFHTLDDTHCSLTWSLDLCRAVNQYLQTKELRQCFVNSLHLITSVNDKEYESFKNESCFQKSFIRDSSISNVPLQQISQLLHGEEVYYPLTKVPVSFILNNGERFGFDYSQNKTICDTLPNDIVAFIGENGAGKSTLLYNVVKVLYADADTRNKYNYLSVDPVNIGINKLLMFSYSSFDNFSLPGMCLSDFRRIYSELDMDRGRFVFSGIRDVKAEYAELIDAKGLEDESKKVIEQHAEYKESIPLKSLHNLADEFIAGLMQVSQSSRERVQDWKDIWKMIQDTMPQFAQRYDWASFDDIWAYDREQKEELKTQYLHSSTGIKFFLHCIVTLLVKIDYGSVILFDEPENHLQPPLLSLLLRILRHIASKYDSAVMVATHSPIVVQETHARNVFIVSRDGENIKINHPMIETFGESFGFINNLVFNLSIDYADYDKEVRLLYDKLNCKDLTAEAAIKKMEEYLGANLSSQMTALVIQIKEDELCGN